MPEELIAAARELELPAMALLDRDGVYGAPRFHTAARRAGLRPLVGAEIAVDGGGRVALLCEDRRGYKNLCRLISAGHSAAGKEECRVTPEQLADLSVEQLLTSSVAVSSVSRRPGSVQQSPAAVTVITQEDIRRSGATSTGDVVMAVRLSVEAPSRLKTASTRHPRARCRLLRRVVLAPSSRMSCATSVTVSSRRS